MMVPEEIWRDRDGIKEILRRAGKIAIESRNQAVWDEKGTKDLVSSVDYSIQEVLRVELGSATGTNEVLAEESSGVIDDREFGDGWIIDPLDGTMNYKYGIPLFAVSAAFLSQGDILAAFTYAPEQDELFFAVKGFGAYKNDLQIHTNCSSHKINHWLGSGSTGGLSMANCKGWNRLIDESRSFRRLGCTTLALAYVACGRLDYMITAGTKVWDIVAGTLLVTEASGFATGIRGVELGGVRYNIAASSSAIIEAVEAMLDDQSC